MTFPKKIYLSMIPGSDGQKWELEQDLIWTPEYPIAIVVRAGYRTDGASIPRLAWRLIGPPFRARYAPAAVIHDALYESEIVPRAVADRLFLDAMAELGVATWRRRLMYWAVRIGGGPTWRKHTRASIAASRDLLTIHPNRDVLMAHYDEGV